MRASRHICASEFVFNFFLSLSLFLFMIEPRQQKATKNAIWGNFGANAKRRWKNWFVCDQHRTDRQFNSLIRDFDICWPITENHVSQIAGICLYYSRSICVAFYLWRRMNKTLEFFVRFVMPASTPWRSCFCLVQWWEGLFTLVTMARCFFFFAPQSYGFRVDLVFFCLCFAIYPVYFGALVPKTNKVDLLSRKRWKSYVGL